jgi:hypothetical protein
VVRLQAVRRRWATPMVRDTTIRASGAASCRNASVSFAISRTGSDAPARCITSFRA